MKVNGLFSFCITKPKEVYGQRLITTSADFITDLDFASFWKYDLKVFVGTAFTFSDTIEFACCTRGLADFDYPICLLINDMIRIGSH